MPRTGQSKFTPTCRRFTEVLAASAYTAIAAARCATPCGTLRRGRRPAIDRRSASAILEQLFDEAAIAFSSNGSTSRAASPATLGGRRPPSTSRPRPLDSWLRGRAVREPSLRLGEGRRRQPRRRRFGLGSFDETVVRASLERCKVRVEGPRSTRRGRQSEIHVVSRSLRQTPSTTGAGSCALDGTAVPNDACGRASPYFVRVTARRSSSDTRSAGHPAARGAGAPCQSPPKTDRPSSPAEERIVGRAVLPGRALRCHDRRSANRVSSPTASSKGQVVDCHHDRRVSTSVRREGDDGAAARRHDPCRSPLESRRATGGPGVPRLVQRRAWWPQVANAIGGSPTPPRLR